MPATTRIRAEAAVQEFTDRRLSGYVTIVLHFRRGEPMPSEFGIHEREVTTGSGPADVLFTVRRS